MNSGRLPDSSFAGTRTETCGPATENGDPGTVAPRGVTAPICPPSAGSRLFPVPITVGDVMPTRSNPLSHPGRQHSQLIAILGHRAARDLNATLLQDVHDRLIRERMLRILIFHELLDLVLDPARRHVL